LSKNIIKITGAKLAPVIFFARMIFREGLALAFVEFYFLKHTAKTVE